MLVYLTIGDALFKLAQRDICILTLTSFDNYPS